MKKTVILSLALSIIILITLTASYLEVDDFMLDNPFWNGLSEVNNLLKPRALYSYSELPMSGYNMTLLIIGPEKNFTYSEAEAVAGFINRGGRVILADESGFGNSLLERLNLSVRIYGGLLVDPLFKERNEKLPRARYLSSNYVGEVVLNYASVIEGCSNPLLSTSSYSYIDENLNDEWDEGEDKGPFTVGCSVKIGEGELIIFSDSSLFINSMIGKGLNKKLLLNIVEDRNVLIDHSHWTQTIFTIIRGLTIQFLRIFNIPEARYTIIFSVFLIMFRFKPAIKKTMNRVSIEDLLKLNPSWSREVLERLAKEIKYG